MICRLAPLRKWTKQELASSDLSTCPSPQVDKMGAGKQQLVDLPRPAVRRSRGRQQVILLLRVVSGIHV